MKCFASFLKKNSFEILNIEYPSTKYKIEEIADIIHQDIHAFEKKVKGKIHFVCYSMGGLVARAYLKQYHIEKLGSIIMIGTPNKGSELADFWNNFWIYKKIFGPAGQQLITDQTKFEHIFSYENYYDIAIIAGNKSLKPISSLIIGKPSDGTVSVESTKLDNMNDHIILPCSHIFLPLSKKVWEQTLYYLLNKKFQK